MISASTWQRCITLLPRCTNLHHLRSTHALFITNGLLARSDSSGSSSTFALSRLILIACTLDDSLSYASLLFHHSPSPPNSFIFNTLIRAHSRSPHPLTSISLFLLMLRSSLPPDHHTFPFVLAACAASASLSFGAQLHSLLSKNGLISSDPFIQTALLRLYLQSDNDLLGLNLFDEIPHKDAVHFDVLMTYHLRRGSPGDALRLFLRMLHSSSRISPDAHTVATALTACSHAGALKLGIWIHNRLLLHEFPRDAHVASTLVNMYAKCGSVTDAVAVFKSAPERSTFMWSSMIGGLAMHGLVREAVECLGGMEGDGLRPDGVVILSVLAACAHAGLVNEGLQLLSLMEGRYGVSPRHEHYSCAVDMLCRVGRLDDAVDLIGRMPMSPLAPVWGSLLTGCRTHGNVEVAEMAAGELQRLREEGGEDEDEGVYVQLSNIYMDANKMEDARRVRRMIGGGGTKKTPARSSIQIDGVASSFVAGDLAHSRRLEIALMLEVLREGISAGDPSKEGRERVFGDDHEIRFFNCLIDFDLSPLMQ